MEAVADGWEVGLPLQAPDRPLLQPARDEEVQHRHAEHGELTAAVSGGRLLRRHVGS